MTDSVLDITVEEFDDYIIDDDVINDLLSTRPVDMYPLVFGQKTVDTVWQDLLSFVQSHSWTAVPDEEDVNNSKEDFDYVIYSDYLEQILFAMLTDLNQATQLLAALVSNSSSNSKLFDDAQHFTRHPARKAFIYYMLGSNANSDIFNINSEHDFNQILEYFDAAPDHIKYSVADYLQKVTPMVYNTSD